MPNAFGLSRYLSNFGLLASRNAMHKSTVNYAICACRCWITFPTYVQPISDSQLDSSSEYFWSHFKIGWGMIWLNVHSARCTRKWWYFLSTCLSRLSYPIQIFTYFALLRYIKFVNLGPQFLDLISSFWGKHETTCGMRKKWGGVSSYTKRLFRN